MVRFSFKRGLRFLQGTKTYTLMRRLASGKFQLEDETGNNICLSESEIHRRWHKSIWQIDEESLSEADNVFYFTTPKDLASLPKEEQEKVKREAAYLRGIKQELADIGLNFVSSPLVLEPKIEKIAKSIEDSDPPSAATIWRWWRKYAPTKCMTKLKKAYEKSGRRIDPKVYSLFEEAVLEVYTTAQKLPRKDVVESVQKKVKRINKSKGDETPSIGEPSPATIYRWLKNLHYQVVATARNGHLTTTRELRMVMGGLKVSRLLERVELDHSPCDVIVICQTTKMILGRPWITLAIDRYSRMIVGFYISFHAPSQSSFLYCMRMAIMPKDDILARFPDVVGPWPARGIMELIASDNGMEEHGNTVEAVCLEMGVILQFCGVAHPEMKGCIERTIGTVQRSLFHRLPGTTFSNIRERGEYKSEDNAALDIEVLTHALVKWIVDVYHKTPHRGLQVRTPLDVWQEAESRTAIELPAFPQQLENIVAIEYTRSLFHYGIQVNNLFYNSPLLQSLRAKTADTLVLRLRTVEDDVGHILVFNPEQGEFFDVPAVNQEYAAGLNGYVHKLIHAETVKRFGNDWRSEQLMEVKAEIQAIVDAAVKDKKMANRKQSAKLRLIDSEQVFRPVSEEPFNISRQPVNPNPEGNSLPDTDDGDDIPTYKRTQMAT